MFIIYVKVHTLLLFCIAYTVQVPDRGVWRDRPGGRNPGYPGHGQRLHTPQASRLQGLLGHVSPQASRLQGCFCSLVRPNVFYLVRHVLLSKKVSNYDMANSVHDRSRSIVSICMVILHLTRCLTFTFLAVKVRSCSAESTGPATLNRYIILYYPCISVPSYKDNLLEISWLCNFLDLMNHYRLKLSWKMYHSWPVKISLTRYHPV